MAGENWIVQNLRFVLTHSRYLFNHLIIGFFALFVLYRNDFLELKIYHQFIFSLIASNVLFVPALFFGKIIFEHHYELKDLEINKFYYLRIFPILLILSYGLTVSWFEPLLIFAYVLVSDLVIWIYFMVVVFGLE